MKGFKGPNLFSSSVATAGEVEDEIDAFERRWLTYPAIAVLTAAVPMIFILALSQSKEYTVICAEGKCMPPGAVLGKTTADIRAVAADEFASFEARMLEYENKGLLSPSLDCECSEQNIRFDTFAAAVPEMIDMCKALEDLFYDTPTYRWETLDALDKHKAYYSEMDVMASILAPDDNLRDGGPRVAPVVTSNQWQGLKAMCATSKRQVQGFLANFNKTKILSPKILKEKTLIEEVATRLQVL